MAALGPAAAIEGKETSFNLPVSRRKVSSALAASISVSFPPGAFSANQCRKRATAAPSRMMRRPRAGEFGRVFARFQERDRIGCDGADAARLPDDAGELFRRRRGVEHNPRALPAKLIEVAFEQQRLPDIRDNLKLLAQGAVELAGIDVEPRLASLQNQRISQRQRRVRDVGAANVEEPGDRMRIADDEGVIGRQQRRDTAPSFSPRPRRRVCAGAG